MDHALNWALAGAIVFSGGCASWPDAGSGGMAERYRAAGAAPNPGGPFGPEHGLHFEQELISRHLDVLVLEGAELCFPATVAQARQRQDRIARELAGGLPFDAANDVVVQRKLLARLERQLDYVKQQQVCTLPAVAGQKTPGELGTRIHDLLNSDHQFAFDSTELDPQYVGRLAQAAELLRDLPAYRLRITGHADAAGNGEQNPALSRARAEQVARYLQIFGLPGARLEVDAVGADAPLFRGTESPTPPTSRRVSIQLIESGELAVAQTRATP